MTMVIQFAIKILREHTDKYAEPSLTQTANDDSMDEITGGL